MFNNFQKQGRRNKFGNKKCTAFGFSFDSQLERDRYLFLRTQLEDGKIKNLERQGVILCEINGVKVCKYIYDFRYQMNDGSFPIFYYEDAKGMMAQHTAIKIKLVKAIFNIDIQIVNKPASPVGIQQPKLRKKSKPKTTKRKLEL